MEWPPHLTVATIVQKGSRYLMVREEDAGKIVINQPAGHLEPGETLFTAAIRETLEETGWQVQLCGVVGIYHYSAGNGTVYHRVCFKAEPLSQLTTSLDPDILEAVWLTLPEILALNARSPLVLACIQDADKPVTSLDFIKHF